MNSSELNLKAFWKPALICAALTFLFANVLIKLGRDWWSDENYSHGLLVPFVIGFIVWSEFDEIKKTIEKPNFLLGITAIIFAVLMLLGGTLGAELFTQRISFVVMIAGIIIYFFGAKILQNLVTPFVLLLLSIPIPQIIFNKIAFPLQIWASQAAVWGIRLFQIPTVRKGNVIEILPNGATQILSLEVVEACSGIRSLMTLVTLALILAYFTRERSENKKHFWQNFDFWRTVILMFAAIPIAVLTNAARVTATAMLAYSYGKSALEGSFHDSLGWMVYVVALVLLFALNIVLKKFKGKAEIQPQIDADKRGFLELETIANRKSQIANILPIVLILVFSGVFINWLQQRGEAQIARKTLAEMPQTLGDWRQKGSEIRFGEQTESVLRVSDYTMREFLDSKNRLANIYVGYYASQRTGATYHSPQNCLPGAGWVMKEPEIIEIKTADGKTFNANRYIIENGVYKEVMIYWYQGRGRIEPSEYRDKINTVLDSILRRRSDGALVRVMTSVGNDETQATEAAKDLSAKIAEKLSEYVPE
ncbi:MAG TPA: VPLPA-CTERM-specific exosortase XrtD [Pyrinomonadaceae bacterium]|nr:VPLPA-CTERM-specific exosortase XrtD [Pyrinomonadaceae bacterium]